MHAQFLPTESPLKMMKNLFYLNLKFLSVFEIFNFCLDFLVMQKSVLIRNVRLISKFMTSQCEKRAIAIHVLPNISRSKGNQTIKFGQLIEYNMKNIFLEILCTKC